MPRCAAGIKEGFTVSLPSRASNGHTLLNRGVEGRHSLTVEGRWQFALANGTLQPSAQSRLPIGETIEHEHVNLVPIVENFIEAAAFSANACVSAAGVSDRNHPARAGCKRSLGSAPNGSAGTCDVAAECRGSQRQRHRDDC